MKNYLVEIDMLLNDVQKIDQQKVDILEEFNHEIPGSVAEHRKKRVQANEKAKKVNPNLKRPAMIADKKKSGNEVQGAGGCSHHHEHIDDYKMLSTNCKFKKPIKELLKDL